MSTALVISLIVHYDYSFENFHPNKENIFRITTNFNEKKNSFYSSGVSIPLIELLRKDPEGVENVAGFYEASFGKANSIRSGTTIVTKLRDPKQIIFADGEYFKIFRYDWLHGSITSSLLQPNSVVLTESRAKRYFPKLKMAEIVGRQLVYDDSIHVTITGVVKDFDRPTDFNFKEFISSELLRNNTELRRSMDWDSWSSTGSSTQLFVRFNSINDTSRFNKRLITLAQSHVDKESIAYGTHRTFHLQALDDIHFNERYGNFDQQLANRSMLNALMIVAGFLLLLGCINFINLSTAQASNRLKEIGVRKTLGGSQKQLIYQFLIETFIVTVIAALVSILLTPLFLHIFNDYIPNGLTFNLAKQLYFLPFLGLLIVVVSLLSGFYPALILSRQQPISILKNNANRNKEISLRKWLTIAQFIIAQIFIMATLLVGKQIHFLLNKDLGFKKDAIFTVQMPWKDKSKSKRLLFIAKLGNIPEIEKVGLGAHPPSAGGQMSHIIEYQNNRASMSTEVDFKFGDRNYFDIYHLMLVAGRSLSSDTAKELIINESYAKMLGFRAPAQAVGKHLKYETLIPIVGVMKDFNQSSLRNAIKPLAFTSKSPYVHIAHIALKTKQKSENWRLAIAKTEEVWKSIYPEDAFEYRFVDEQIASFYRKEQSADWLLKWATGMSILISCMGLLGLAVYTINQRTKEIGVRKVLGASSQQIVTLLSKDFIRLIVIAFTLATPITWFAMQKWLENFAYKVELEWSTFLLSGILMIAIALLTIGIQTLKAAVANPVKSLRTE